jgi:exopolysaccharide production protein ExoZ
MRIAESVEDSAGLKVLIPEASLPGMNDPRKAQGRKMPTIQVLRGIAAMMVVLHHYSRTMETYVNRPSWISSLGLGGLGASGVDIFFVISGFIMVYTTDQKPTGSKAALSFLEHRVLRIFPLYWLWTSTLLVLWAAGFAMRSHYFSKTYIVFSYLLIPAFSGRDYQPLLPQGWTLSFEMLFYLVFAVSILLRVKRRRLPFIGVGFVLLWFVGLAFPEKSGIRYLFTEPIIFEFLLGILAAEILLRLPYSRWWNWMPAILVSVGASGLLVSTMYKYPPFLRCVAWGVPAFALVLGGAMFCSVERSRLFVYLGDASYSIYLTHGFFNEAYEMALKRFSLLGRISPDLSIILLSLFTIALSSLTYRWIERRVTAFLSLRKRQGEATGLAATHRS